MTEYRNRMNESQELFDRANRIEQEIPLVEQQHRERLYRMREMASTLRETACRLMNGVE